MNSPPVLPGFVEKAADIKAKAVDTIACLSVNDVFVMDAWGKDQEVGDKVLMLADGNGDYSRALGLLGWCLFAALTLMPLSGRTKDLGAADSHLAWLYSLPISGTGLPQVLQNPRLAHSELAYQVSVSSALNATLPRMSAPTNGPPFQFRHVEQWQTSISCTASTSN